MCGRNFDFLGDYCPLPNGYYWLLLLTWWLLLVTARYGSLLLVTIRYCSFLLLVWTHLCTLIRQMFHLDLVFIQWIFWVLVYELSGSGFESSCSHLNFRFRASFEQEVPWHSGNYRTWIHSKTRTWHDKKIQSLTITFIVLFRKKCHVENREFRIFLHKFDWYFSRLEKLNIPTTPKNKWSSSWLIVDDKTKERILKRR